MDTPSTIASVRTMAGLNLTGKASERRAAATSFFLSQQTTHRSVNQHTNPAPSSTVTPSGDCRHDCPLQGEATPAVLCWRAETNNTH